MIGALLRRLAHSLGGAAAPNTPEVVAAPMMHRLVDPDNPVSINVIAIRNGFLAAYRVYNPNGPDRIDATFAPSAEELGPLLVAMLAAQRITK